MAKEINQFADKANVLFEIFDDIGCFLVAFLLTSTGLNMLVGF